MRIEALDLYLSGQAMPLGNIQPIDFADAEPQWFETSGLGLLDNSGRTIPLEAMGRTGRVRGKNKVQSGRSAMMNPDLDLHEITKMLNVGQNKLRILRLLRRSDLINILHLLPTVLLVNALRLFNKQKLLRMLMMLPKQFLLKMLLKLFKIDELIQKMPTGELMRILRSGKLNNRELVKGLQKMDPKFILLLLQRIYGDFDYSKLKPYEIMQIFMQTNKDRMMEAFKTLPFKALVPFVTGFVKQDQELLLNISDAFIAKLLDRLSKPTLLQGCLVLPDDILIKMLTQLPNQMLLLAAAQIDDNTLEQYLISQQPDLLKMLAGVA